MSRLTARSRVGDFDDKSPRSPAVFEESDSVSCNNNPLVFPTNSPSAPRKYSPRSPCITSTTKLDGNGSSTFEPGGNCSSCGGCQSFNDESRTPPSCLSWAKNFSCLLQDDEGIALFRRYLEREGPAHADTLNFWFACEGLKKQVNQDLVAHVVKAICRKFIVPPVLAIREDLRREVIARIRANLFDRGVFDGIQAAIGELITTTTYPHFLQSDIYLNYIHQNSHENCSSGSGSGSGSGSSSSSAGRDVGLCGGPFNFLPTVLEDSELEVNSNSLPLTKDALAKTEIRRVLEVRPKPEAFAGIYLQHGQQMNTKVYSSYNPVSRQDSELQSLSSDARTDPDAMSCTDNSVDGVPTCPQKLIKRQHQRQLKVIKENASINKDTTHLLIPRTQRSKEGSGQLSAQEFSAQLIEKLEALKKKQEAQEKFDRKLMETECEHEKTLADMIREKLQVEEQDSDNQAILDQHVSRVWSDTTPSRSPRISSPKPKSPDGRRRLPVPLGRQNWSEYLSMMATQEQGVPHPYQIKTAYSMRYPKKDKDVFSTFSADSGNIHDFTDVSESGRNFPKSKSFPDYVDQQNTVSGHERARNNREPSSRRFSSKKRASEIFDSGVSVISDTVPCAGKHSAECRIKESCDRTKYRYIKQPLSALVPHRHGKKSERSGSLERYPVQPYSTDLTAPNTAILVEEARRRLEQEEAKCRLNRMRFPVSNKITGTGIPDLSFSNQSTLRKSARKTEPSPPLHRPPDQEYMTVMYSFWDEEVPYRTKVPGTQVTLRQFKDLLPRKGNYRYYFKTECPEVDTKTVHEEIFDDNQELPLWEGKLIAQVKPYD